MLDAGIYTIESRVNSCRYVGSAASIKKRWRDHVRQLSQGVPHRDIAKKLGVSYSAVADIARNRTFRWVI